MKIKKVLLSLLFLSFVLSISFVTLSKEKVIAATVDKGSSGAYIPSSSTIKNFTYSKDTIYLQMSDFYTDSNGTINETSLAPLSNQIINISTSKDLYAFSVLANSNNRFLTYNYQLTNNIDYGQEIAFNSVGTITPFSGSFKGNGNEISNLHFRSYTSEEEGIQYIAMFSKNSGIIDGVGLVDTELVQSVKVNNIYGVAPLVGLNTGTISNVFVQDLRDPYEEAGISAVGYYIAGLCFSNNGKINNAYVAYSTIINYTIFDYEAFRPIVADINDLGTIENVYFYDTSIDSIQTIDGTNYYVYDESLLGDVKVPVSNVKGEYVSELSILRNKFSNIDGWYSNDTYSISYFDLKLPIYKGLEEANGESKAFLIKSTNDFAYLYQLFNQESYFASNDFTYYIINDLDVSIYPASCFKYDDFISCKFIGKEMDSESLFTFNNGKKSKFPTIYNPYLNNTINYLGFKSYGLFPLFDGTLKNINIYLSETFNKFEAYDSTTPVSTFGIISGYVEGGNINNVNVYGNVSLIDTLGQVYIGGACGILSQNSKINDLTISGTINGSTINVNNLTNTISQDYISGNIIGGAIAFLTNDSSQITNVITNVNIQSISYNTSTSYDSYIGGGVGSGYFDSFNNISSFGTISTSSSTSYYGSLYIGGIVGSIKGVNNRLFSIHNQTNINVSINEIKDTYISGIFNVNLNNNSKLNTFYGAGLSNSGIIKLTNNLTLTSSNANTLNLNVTQGVYIENAFEINGLYNLEYDYDNTYNKEKLDDIISIDVSLINKYAPCLIKTNDYYGVLKSVYNHRDINLVSTKNIYFNDVLYTGCVIGKNINMTDIRNEGNINATISNNATTSLTNTNGFKKFIITGVFEEVSSGYSANIISNNGNINFYLNSNVSSFIFNLYISGICYANRSNFNDSSYKKYNPLDSTYDESLVGSLNNAINNGTITSTNYASETITINSTDIKSANNKVVIGRTYSTSNNSNSLVYGSSNISGVCAINESIISNSFNIGDITNFNYIVNQSGSYAFKRDFEVNSGGITFINVGKYAQIKDSANDGAIKAFNMSSSTNSWANSAGISVRNDIDEDYNDYDGSTNNASQMILFTINYGEVYSHNYCENVDSIEKEQHAKSAGIMALGLCSVINTVNYANIYGSEISSGIFGLIKFSLFKDEVTNTNKVIIANSINYGNIWGINKGSQAFMEEYKDDSTKDNQTYDELMAMSFSNQADYASIDTHGFAKDTYLGSIVGIANFDNNDNAQNISIRYLINFCSSISIIGGEYGISSNINPNVDTMVSTYLDFTNGLYTFDSFMGKTVQYGPLSTGTEEILGVTYLGVFNQNFQFRKAVEGKIEATENTDKFISDFFQFVAFTKVNDYLIEKIGWRTIAYLNASLDFANDLTSLEKVLEMYKSNVTSTTYNSLVTKALNTDSWISNCNADVVSEIAQMLIKDKDLTNLQELLNYLFFESSNTNAITSTIKSNVVIILMNYINNNKDIDIKEFVNNILFKDGENKVFSTILTDVFSSNAADKIIIQEKLQSYFSSLSQEQLYEIVNAYIELLENDDIVIDYIKQNDLSNAKRKVIKILLTNIDSNIILDIYKSLDISSIEESKVLKINFVLESMSDLEKQELFDKILSNNTSNSDISDIIDALNSEIKYYENVSTKLDTSISQDSDFALSSNYLKLWNQVRLIPEFKTYLETLLPTITSISNTSHKGIYAKATEARNTYQSTTKPAYDGRNAEEIKEAEHEILIFNYEKEVTPDTYFYGPFRTMTSDSRASGFPSTIQTKKSPTITYLPNYTDIMNTKPDSQYNKVLVNGFVTTDLELATQKGFAKQIFFYDNQNHQFVSKSHFDAFFDTTLSENAYTQIITDFSGCILDDGVTQISKFNLTSGNTSKTAKGTYTLRKDGVTTTISNADATSYAQYILDHAVRYYISADTVTGLYMVYNPWYDGRASYFTAKVQVDQMYWFTTQYIDYSSDDLVKLDGKLTGYTDSYVESQDEINIINNICQNYLFSSSNINTSIKVIKRLLLQLFKEDASFVNTLLNTIASNNNTNVITGNSTTIKDYLTIEGTTSFTNYLINLYKGDTSDDVSIYSAINFDNFKFTINYLLNQEYGYYSYLYNKLDLGPLNDETKKYLFDFIVELKNNFPTITDDEIITVISSLDKDTLLNNLKDFDPKLNEEIATIGDNYTLSNIKRIINVTNFNNKSYVFGLTSASSNGTITFNANRSGSLFVIASGSGTISYGDQSYIINGINKYNLFEVNNNTEYTLLVSQGVVIYELGYDYFNNSQSILTYGNTFTREKLESTETLNVTQDNSLIGSFSFNYILTNSTTSDNTITIKPTTNSKFIILVKGNVSTGYELKGSNATSSFTISLTYSYNSSNNYTSITSQNSGTNSQLRQNTTYTLTVPSGSSLYGIILYNSGTPTTSYNYNFENNSSSSNDFESIINDYAASNTNNYINNSYGNDQVSSIYNSIYNALTYKRLLASNSNYDGFTLTSLTTSPIVITDVNKTINNNTYTKAFNLNNVNNNIKFTVNKDCYVLVSTSNNVTLSYGTNSFTKGDLENTYVFSLDNITSNTEVTISSNNANTLIYDIIIINKSNAFDTMIDNLYPSFPNSDTERETIKTLLTNNKLLVKYAERFKLFVNNPKRSDEIEELNSLYKNDFINLITLLSGAKFNYSTDNSLWNILTNEQAEEFAILLGIASDDVLKEYILNINNKEILEQSILELTNNEKRFVTSLIEKTGIDNLTDEQKQFITAAYVSTNFNTINENSKNNASITVKDSELFTIIRALDTQYRYYNSDGTMDNSKFEDLMSLIGFNLATQGYGIYALASSHGILNGAFIPDNYVLNEEANNPNYELNGDYFIISSTPSSDWRSKVHNDDESTANSNSINYAIKKEMKQLKLSIATTIFDLVLENEEGYKLTTESEYINLDIDENKGLITYYVVKNLGENITGSNVNYKIFSYDISDKATLEAGYETKIFKIGNNNILRVYAEDRTVYKDYTINFVLTNDLEMTFISYKLNDSALTQIDSQENITINNIDYNNGKLLLNSDVKNIANLINLTRYIYIDGKYQSTDDDPLFSFNEEPLVNSVTNDNGITWDGNVILDITFSPNLTGGEHTLDFIFSDNVKYSIKLNKDKSSDATLISLTFDGVTIDFSSNKNQISNILFGRYFSYNDLTIQDNSNVPSYLDNMTTSPLATVKTEARMEFNGGVTEEVNGTTVYTGGIMSYIITYTITSEDGTVSNEYTHTLIEVEPFNNAKTGDSFITGSSYNKHNYVSMYQNGNVLDVTPDENGVIKTSFSRGNNPKYRAIYNLDDFYKPQNKDISDLIDVESSYDITQYPDANTRVFTSNIKNKGFVVNFYSGSELDDYNFNLVYESTTTPVIWENNEMYRRKYISPSVIITKTKSTDAFLKKITFITEATKLANLATVASLNTIYADNTDGDNEKVGNTYKELVENQSKDFVITTTYGITYLTEEAKNATDYYIVGSVSNANLDDYSPLFKIEDHASIYQYQYFNNERYLIVSFFDENNNKITTYADESLTNFYLMNEDRTLGSRLEVNLDENIKNYTITYNNVQYKINEFVGEATNANVDLFMNFVSEESSDLDDLYFVDYVVYAEAFTKGSNYYKNYHISVIDLTNSIYFTFTINDKTDKQLYKDKKIFVQFVCYDSSDKTTDANYKPSKVLHIISAYAKFNEETNAFVIENSFQALPYGYYYIYLDLQDATDAIYTITDKTKLNKDNQLNDNSYIPPTSIITQRINLSIDIIDSTSEIIWGERLDPYTTVLCKKNANN